VVEGRDLPGGLEELDRSGGGKDVQPLEAQGLVAASWQLSDRGKQAKYYRLTARGRKQLLAARTRWEVFARAIGLVLEPSEGDA